MILGFTAAFTVSAFAMKAPVLEIKKISLDGNRLVASINLTTGSFNAIDISFKTAGLECVSIKDGSDLHSDATTGCDTNPAIGVPNISIFSSEGYKKQGEMYVVTFNILSDEYSFDLDVTSCTITKDDGNNADVTDSVAVVGAIVVSAGETFESGTCGENVTYSLNKNTGVLTISGTGKMADYSSNRHSPFYKNKKIKEVIIEDGVTSIGSCAFEECISLTSITIPEGVTRIGSCAFYGCSSLTSITISEGVRIIDSHAFYGCKSLTSITIPEGVASIGIYVFYGCSSLTSIAIPKGVTSIGSFAFYGCSSLTSITIPEGVTSIGNYVFYGCSSLTSIAIPKGVTSIGSSAFENCSGLTSVTIPDSVTSIDYQAFYYCSSLTSATIPKNVTSIGINAFMYCSSLTSVTVPEGVAHIDSDAFSYVNNIIYNGSLSGSPWGAKCINGYIEDGLVYKDSSKKELLGCSSSRTESVSIPNSVEKIGDRAFYNCSNLVSITIPESVKNMGFQAFWMVNNIIYNHTNSQARAKCINGYIEDGLVYKDSSKKELLGCSSSRTGSVSIPNSVEKIGDYAFYNCSSLTSITIPDGVTSIGNDAFYNCSKWTSVTIPKNVTSISFSAFKDCSSLTSITIPEGVTSIYEGVFSGCRSLTSVAILEGVTSIGTSAFKDCESLISIAIPDSVTSISKSAFSGCSSLTSVTIPEGVTSINESVFSGCRSLTSVTIPEGVTSIGSYAFYGCRDMTSVTISKSVITISEDAFNICDDLKDVYYRGSKEEWEKISIGSNNNYLSNANIIYNYQPDTPTDNLTFSFSADGTLKISGSGEMQAYEEQSGFGWYGLRNEIKTVIFDEGVTNIAAAAFKGYENLSEVILCGTITDIGASAFENCGNLKFVTFKSSPAVGDNAFKNHNGKLLIIGENNNGKRFASNQNIKYLPVSYNSKKEALVFSKEITVYKDLGYYFITDFVRLHSQAKYLYFERLVFDGVLNEGDIDLSCVDDESNYLSFDGLYVSLVAVTENGKEQISFEQMLNLMKEGKYDAFKFVIDGHEETPLDRINERFENFFQDALKTVTRVINFFKRVFR